MKVVVKVGGTLLETAEDRLRIVEQVARQARAGHQILLVHGGGKQLTQFLDRAGVASRFVDGFRVTTAETLDGVVKVFAGTVNHELLATFVRVGLPAVGLSGIDASCLVAEKLLGPNGQDWGFVGKVVGANPALWDALSVTGYVPVMACLAVGKDGQIYNVNADQAAVACAVHWKAERLIFLTDVDGVRDAHGLTVTRLGGEEIPGLIATGAVTGGMLAKLSAVQEALANHIPGVVIGNGRGEGTLDGVLNAVPESRVSGTLIVAPLAPAKSQAIEAAVKGVD